MVESTPVAAAGTASETLPGPQTTFNPNSFRPNPFRPLRFGDYRYVWSSEALNLWASEMETIVLAIFVLRDTNSPLLVGLIGALKFGGTLLGPLYGLMVDRFDRKKLQVGVRVIGVSLATLLASLVITDTLELWHAYLIVTAGSMVRMLDIVLVQTLTADVVPGYSLHGAIGLSRISLDGARVAGSIAGGTIFELLGLDWAYVMIASLYLLATLLSLKIRSRSGLRSAAGPGEPVRSSPGIRSELADGLRYVMRSPVLPGLVFFSFLIELSAFPTVNGLMTVVGDELYGLGGTGIGLLAAAASVGGLAGALVLGMTRNVGTPTRVMVLSSVAWHTLMLVLALPLPLWLFVIVLIAWGFCGGMTFVAMVVGLLRAAPPEVRGRVMGIRSLGIYGLPIGLLLGGWIAETSGARAMIGILGGIGLFATVSAAVRWPALLRGSPRNRSDPGDGGTVA
ncbi:MAG: MFS transporter [Chloroflexi bacterium]|nr:MFS transporter [Chloroflexota bacterium]